MAVMDTAVTASDRSPDPAELDRLIAGLDVPARIRLLTGASGFTLAPEPSIDLHELRMSDGPTGVRGLKFSGDHQVSLFPNATLLAGTWSTDVLQQVGALLAEEALAQQIHVVLGPTINLHRTALGGRLFEAYSEDPLLSGVLAAAYVRGLQQAGVGACLKHLVANESETMRHTVNSVLDEATLRELYLLPFEIAVVDAHPWTVMAAYNDVNGVPATEQDHVINEVLKGEWGWDGLVVSDWFATKSAAPAANGGLDLVMPGPDGPWGQAMVEAVRAGAVDEAVIDEHLRRLLRLAARVGVLGTERDYPDGLPAPDGATRREQLTQFAAGGMTVLTNSDAVLPLAGTGQRIALIGRHALATIDMGGGSAQVNPPHQVSIAEGLTELLGDAVTVTDGVPVRSRPVPARPGIVLDPETGQPGIHVQLRAADGSVLDDRHRSLAWLAVGFDDDLPAPVATATLRATLRAAGPLTGGGSAAGPIQVGVMGAGEWQLQVGDRISTHRLQLAGSGFDQMMSPPTAVEQVPGGGTDAGIEVTATVTLPSEGPMASVGLFGLVAGPVPGTDEQAIAEAVRAAADADVAVVVIGLTEEQETEGADKSSLALPGAQDALVRAVAAAAPRTVVVVNAATPVLMPWLGEVDAVLVAGLPGQEGGHAVAAALLGRIEPAGRLVTSYPAADGASPAWSVTPRDGALEYTEGRFIGYRGYAADRAQPPAFWFGHGLGYGAWDYADARIDPPGDGDGAPTGSVTVSVTLANTASRASREVVQLYWRPGDPDEPVRLVGWAAATIPAGGSTRVRVSGDRRMWRRWDTAAGAWTTLPADGTLLLARGLGDVRAELPLGGAG